MKSGRSFGRLIGVSATVAATAVLVLGFQNCSEPVPGSTVEQQLAASSKIEFGYDSSIDQIAYMSCAMADVGTYDAGAYFSFRFGAYRSAGLRLNEAFLKTHGRKPFEKQSELLMDSPANTSTSLQFAIRQRANFQVMYTASGTSVKGQDYVNVLEPLGGIEISDMLAKLDSTKRLRYMRNGTVFGSRLEGSLYFTKNPTLAGSFRTFMRNDAMLAQTFSHTPAGQSVDTFARTPRDVVPGSTASSSTQAYGRGYKVEFAQPSIGAVASNANFGDVTLRAVTEMNLTSPTDSTGLGSWSCPDTMRFRIVRPEDAKAGTAVACAMVADPAVLSAELAIVRNQLRAEDWYVDMNNRCIVPKKSPATCYGTTATSVQYDITRTCTEGTGAACVSFASICYRP